MTLPTPTAEANERELLAMARMLRRGHGTFVLAFARCNVPAQRERLVSALSEVLIPLKIKISEVTLSGLDADIYKELMAAPRTGNPLFVYGLESVMPSADPYRALFQLNERRGRYQALARPVVFWVAEYALRLIAEKAPDFWAWRSGVYEFAAEPAAARETSEREGAVPLQEMAGLNRAEKKERIRLLTALLDDYRGDDPETRSARSRVLLKLGQMHLLTGQYQEAEHALRRSLQTFEELGDRHSIVVTQSQLAVLYQVRGDYERAEQLYRIGLKIAQELGEQNGIALVQSRLATLYQLRGDDKQAERLFRESLKIKEKLGDRFGIAVTKYELAFLFSYRGDYSQAERLYRESLKVANELGDRHGAAIAQNHLAELYQQRGDYEQAERLYQESLKTRKELGDPKEIAVTLHNLAMMLIDQEQLTEALGLLVKSHDRHRELRLEKEAAIEEGMIHELQRRLSEAKAP